jgi:hypothetical protein
MSYLNWDWPRIKGRIILKIACKISQKTGRPWIILTYTPERHC